MASTGEVWKLGRRPALDGVRGIAILLVLACHTLTWPFSLYGQPGVDMFFTLSGFLITSLLLEERQAAGRLHFGRFYRRRALRLLPALVVYVLVMTLVRVSIDGRAMPAFAAAGLVLGYVGDWAISFGMDLGYLGQTWSLAVEEQFYLAWPVAVVALVRIPRRARIAACVGVVAAVCAWRWMLFSASPGLPDRMSLVRAAPLLIGCATAFYLQGTRDGRSMPRLAALIAASILVVPWLPEPTAFQHVTTGVLTSGLILCCVRGVGVHWLQWAPLRLLGLRSYGLYLWHYPVLLPAMMLPVHGWQRVVVAGFALAAAWGLTLLSWRYVEQPFLRLKDRPVTRPSGSLASSGSLQPS